MSAGAAAYREQYAQEPPAGAHYGVDMSWWQASSGDVLSYGVARDYWERIAGWAEWVTLRGTYGRGGDDGAYDLHLRIADEVGYTGRLGLYHYHIPSSGQAQAANFVRVWQRLRDRLDHAEYDHEEASHYTVVRSIIDEIEQTTQLPTLYYTGKSIGDQAGHPDPWRDLITAHYANGNYQAWTPISNYRDWCAPLVPEVWLPRGTNRLCWQYTSQTQLLGSLDLMITTTPELYGLGGTDEMSAEQYEAIMGTLRMLVDMVATVDTHGAQRDSDLRGDVYSARDYLFDNQASWLGMFGDPKKDRQPNLLGEVEKLLARPPAPDAGQVADAVVSKIGGSPGQPGSVDWARVRQAVVDTVQQTKLVVPASAAASSGTTVTFRTGLDAPTRPDLPPPPQPPFAGEPAPAERYGSAWQPDYSTVISTTTEDDDHERARAAPLRRHQGG